MVTSTHCNILIRRNEAEEMTKSVILISVIGMLAGLFLCISAADSNFWFVVGFSLFLGNMSMFYLALKRGAEKAREIK